MTTNDGRIQLRTSPVKNVYNDLEYADNESTIHSIHLGTGADLAIKPYASSGPRVTMYCGHAVQQIHVVGCENRASFTGNERKYSKHMFNVKVMEDCCITKIFNRTEFGNSRRILERTIFVEIRDTHEIHVYNIPAYDTNHQQFGFEYKDMPQLRVGMYLKEGTVLAQCPSVINNEFCQGVNANVIFISSPEVIEDAVTKSQSLCDRLLSYGYKTFRMHIGGDLIPLHLYGTEEEPRMFPSVGEKIRRDGILYAQRMIRPELAAVELSNIALRQCDKLLDIPCYADIESEVIDIKVYRNNLKVDAKDDSDGTIKSHAKMKTLTYQQSELDRYYNGMAVYMKSIRDYYLTIEDSARRASRGTPFSNVELPITNEAHTMFRDAIAVDPAGIIASKDIKNLVFSREQMEDYTVEITVKYPVPFAESSKSTDCAGGKGVTGKKCKDKHMPFDDFGNRVDIMMSDNAVFRRTNFNRTFEAYMGAAARDVRIDVLDMYEDGRFDDAWEYLMGFIDAASPEFADKMTETYVTEEEQRSFIEYLKNDRLRMWFPQHSRKPMDIAERDVERYYPPRRSQLTTNNPDGTVTRTVNEFIVGVIYIMRLQQTGREFSAVSACKYQPFGTIATPHTKDKQQRYISEKPISFLANSEWRHLNGFQGDDQACADIHDMSNNPMVQQDICYNILTAAEPTNIKAVVDREKYPLGHNRVMKLVDSMFKCEGFEFTDRKGNLE